MPIDTLHPKQLVSSDIYCQTTNLANQAFSKGKAPLKRLPTDLIQHDKLTRARKRSYFSNSERRVHAHKHRLQL